MYEDLKEQTRNSFNELCETAQFKPGSLWSEDRPVK